MKDNREKLEDELLDLSGHYELSDEEAERVYEVEKKLEEKDAKW